MANHLKARHFLRLHAFLLFVWTFGSAYMISRMLFAAGVETMSTRYALSSTAGYLVFLLGVRIWLWHVGAVHENGHAGLDAGDAVDIVDLASDLPLDAVAEGAGEAISGLGESLGAAAGEGCIPVLVIGLLAIAVALLFALAGPELLIECAFEAVLAGSLVAAMRLGREPDWLWTVFRKTIWIFLVIALAMILFGKYAQKHYPKANTMKQVIQQMRGHVSPVPIYKKP